MKTLLIGVALVMLAAGCASNKKVDALLAMTETQSKRQGITESVLMELAKRDRTVVADTLANVDKGTAVGWCHGKRAIRTAENQPLLDTAGNVQFEEYEAIGKSASVREVAGYTEAEFRLAGFAFNNKTGVLDPNSLPEGLTLNLRGFAAGGSTLNKDVADAYMGAPGAEKKAIGDALATVIDARGKAFALKVDALTKGMATFTTAAGTFAATVLKTTVLPLNADLMAAGVTKLVSAVVRKEDGTLTDVVASDSPASPDATTCIGCEETPAQ